MGLTGFAECLPYHENYVKLNKDVLDIHGQPTLTIDAEWKENEKNMRPDMMEQAAEMLEAAGLKNVNTYDANFMARFGYSRNGNSQNGSRSKDFCSQWIQPSACLQKCFCN